MTSPSRISHRHLLALCTFLVPLAVLAVLGWSELQRSGAEAQAALAREARQFLHRAAQAIDQQFEQRLPALLAATEAELGEHGPVRATLRLRQAMPQAGLLDLLLLDEQFALVWPTPPPGNLGLPFAREERPRGDGTAAAALQAIDLLLAHGEGEAAKAMLQHLLAQLEAATPQARGGRRPDLDEAELMARFRLATVHRRLGDRDAARTEFEAVVRAATPGSRPGRLDPDAWAVAVLAEAALAELGSVAERIKLLRAIAESRRDFLADGLLSAIARRLAAGIAEAAAERPEVDTLLTEEHQRAQSRAFAGAYDLVLKFGLRLRRMRAVPPEEADPDGDDEQRLVSTLSGRTTLLAVRPATAGERQRLRCTRVGVHLDLETLLAPAIAPLAGDGATFALAIHDETGAPMLPPPAAVPADFVPPGRERHGLTLRAFPANAERIIAEADAAARNRTALMLALFAAAFGGGLWLWRSASREAELAALKIDLVSRVSHELKTPLALIRMYGETLGMGRARDPEQAASFGGIIARESERLTLLIQRILDFSRQQAGTLTYEPTRVDLGALLRTVCDAYTPHLEARGAILVDTLPLGIHVHCDRNAGESAIVNLLENAAKYARDGDSEHEVELELRTEPGYAVVEVRDRGRGIPPDELERVFDSFHRASNAGEVRGAGLGLSLVRHFAEAHGGTVTAHAREGGGTVLRLRLPRAGTDPGGDLPARTDPP
ncbi:MAG: HAMP domain-containing histidine kinase [Planctomycetes bacterium]|nr:HAMP domain-containing histidine kinase [Planctomycetota bacterium]